MSPIYGGVSMASVTPSGGGNVVINGNGASITAYMVGLKHSF